MSEPADAVPYDAVLLASFGGPEGPDEVLPFLENVTRGRGVPRERLLEVGEHYLRFSGVSPTNAQCRALLAAVRADFAGHDVDLPVYWGNRNWHPLLADTVQQMTADGVRRALAFVTAAYASYPGCRQYREDLAAARAAVGPGAPRIDKIRHYFNDPGFVEPMVDSTVGALEQLRAEVRGAVHLVFSTHSIPEKLARSSGPFGDAYIRQHLETARLVAAGVERVTGRAYPWTLAYQSRSGPPSQPWLEPDVVDELARLSDAGVPGVVLVPIGFVSDHMEVVYDLDTEAVAAAEKLRLPVSRAATVGTDPRFVTMIRELVLERISGERLRLALGELGPSHDVCPAGCCPNPRGPRPAVAGVD